jgi:multidrug efflux system membrane fusion protein
MSRRLPLALPGGLLLALTAVLPGCGPGGPPVAEIPPPPVSVSKPVARKVTDFDPYEGRIGAMKTWEVRARVSGHLVKVNFEAGEVVKKGALLYEIDPRPAKAALDSAQARQSAAEANLEFAKAEYLRYRKLAVSGAATREEVESWLAKRSVAAGDVDKAKAAVEQAQLDLDFTRIAAPMAGKLSRTLVDEGNLVNAGGGETLLTTLVSIDPIYVYFYVDERSLLRYRKLYRREAAPGVPLPPIKELHIPVYVALEGEQDYPHQGEIDFADNKVNPSTGTIQVRGVLANRERIFDDGMRARVRIPVGEAHDALLISEEAIANDQGKKFVYVVTDQNVAERRYVELGRISDGLQGIERGLEASERVIVNGIQRVREGMKVEPHEVAMPGDRPPAEAKQEKTTTK